MRLAVIQNGVVVRVAEAPTFEAEPQGVLCPDVVQVGDFYNTGTQTFTRSLERLRTSKATQVQTRFDQRWGKSISFGGYDWDVGTEERELLVATVAAGGVLPTTWEDATGTERTIDVGALLADILAKQKQLQRKRRRLLREVAAATTVEALDAIDW